MMAKPLRVKSLSGAHLESTTIWRLESRQNPQAGKRALRSAAFPGCGLAELSSSATGARLRRTLVLSGRVRKRLAALLRSGHSCRLPVPGAIDDLPHLGKPPRRAA